ncbi:hypothetical protein [Facklamia sp. 7083-14-GEN3]|uniref:hypothetical protein n=1 Tax=Facklamia sp. 7083-14-GEN3 TaxID=2973478 RepID=UPI00215C7E20|nr:hypothetical protein [Facklamia sp. 7083-14-GEN3]MCR8968934.1 hypothetical protein [Facklamia sp. 7083-14-GEN3]
MEIKQLRKNTYVSLLNRIITMASAIILPKLIIESYGSETNGLIQSITQFMNIITLLDLGVGSVIQSKLYEPLSYKNSYELGKILLAARKFFKKIAIFLVLYVLFLLVIYPLYFARNYNSIEVGLLIMSIASALFGQYYFGIVNELLLNADRKSYIQNSTEIITIILNLIIGVLVIKLGFSVVVFKFSSSLVFLLRPILLNYYVKTHYNIQNKVALSEDPIPEKWDGMAQHIAYTIQNTIDIVAITMFLNLNWVSVYSIYNMIIMAIKSVITILVVELKSFVGKAYVNERLNIFRKKIEFFEWFIYLVSIFLFSMVCILLIPFINLYTQKLDDINYIYPFFGIFFTITHSLVGIKSFYQSVIFAAGHFKQTRNNAILESIINIIISISFIKFIGIESLVLGSFIALSFRILYLNFYLTRNILFRPIKVFFKQLIVLLVSYSSNLFIGNIFLSFITITSYKRWIFSAISLSMFLIINLIIINRIFYFNHLKLLLNHLKIKKD